MSGTRKSPGRRRFLELALAGVAAPIALGAARRAEAAELPHLEETDPVGSALGYKHDTTKVDAAKYPTHKPEQLCIGCQFAQAPQADGWVPCSLFPGKAVAPKGWCVSWAKKA